MRSGLFDIAVSSVRLLLLVGAMSFAIFLVLYAEPTPQAPSQQDQKTFATPEQAAAALIRAAEEYDVPGLLAIFGPDGKDFLSSADPIQDKNRAEEFAAKARVVNIDPKNNARAVLLVGNDD